MNNLKTIRTSRMLTRKEAARILNFRLDGYIELENGDLDGIKEISESMGMLEDTLKNSEKVDLPTFSKPIFLCPVITKGGTGKTTSVVELAGALAYKGFHVLIVDCTEQVDATLTFFEGDELVGKETVLDAMQKVDDIRKCILTTANPLIDVVPSDYRLDDIDVMLANNIHKDRLLAQCFKGVVSDNMYDFILFDASNHLGVFADVIWMAAERVYLYMVIRAKMYAFSQFSRTLEKVKSKQEEIAKYGQEIVNLGIFMNEVDVRASSTEAIQESIKSLAGDLYIEQYIRRDENINKSQGYKLPVVQYKPSCKGSKDFLALADEIVRRIEVYENGKN